MPTSNIARMQHLRGSRVGGNSISRIMDKPERMKSLVTMLNQLSLYQFGPNTRLLQLLQHRCNQFRYCFFRKCIVQATRNAVLMFVK